MWRPDKGGAGQEWSEGEDCLQVESHTMKGRGAGGLARPDLRNRIDDGRPIMSPVLRPLAIEHGETTERRSVSGRDGIASRDAQSARTRGKGYGARERGKVFSPPGTACGRTLLIGRCNRNSLGMETRPPSRPRA